MNTFTIYNATVVTPAAVLENASVQVMDGVIVGVNRDNALLNTTSTAINANGAIVMPGIIDIHTDALDAEIIPRPGADIPVPIAFRELERKMSGCGFTTVYHSLHLGYEVAEKFSKSKYPRAHVFEKVYEACLGQTLLNNKIHLRFELTGVAAYEACMDLIAKGYISLLSVMDHTPGQGQFTKETFIAYALKEGKKEADVIAEYEARMARPKISDERLQALINYALECGIPVASHDDDTVERVNKMYALGIRLCEFPINMATASHATQLGMHVIGGASNILRGGSLSGNVSMTEAVTAGVVDTLCSDYYPPAILHAIFKLHQEQGLNLYDAVNLATLHPAKAAGISHFTGSIEVGKDADLLLVNMIDGLPMVSHTIVKGSIVSQASVKVVNQKMQTVF